MVAHLGASIAGQTAGRREQLLGANVLAHARAFHKDQHTQLHSVTGGSRSEHTRCTGEVHVLRGDATNSNILQGSKAHVCEVTSLIHNALDTRWFRG